MGVQHRPKGYILSYSSSSLIKKISLFHTVWPTESISSNAIWFGQSSNDIYMTARSSQFNDTFSVNSDEYVFQRLATMSLQPPSSMPADILGSEVIFRTRLLPVDKRTECSGRGFDYSTITTVHDVPRHCQVGEQN